MPPIVLKTLPICSDLNVEIGLFNLIYFISFVDTDYYISAQSTLPNKNNSGEFLLLKKKKG